jgi:uncharacterized membrane protein
MLIAHKNTVIFGAGGTIMNTYTVVKFVHVIGAIGYFVAMGVWLFGLASLQRAQRVEQVRVLTDLLGRLGSLFGISVLIILAAGLYMTFTTWDFQTGWIDVALISLVLIAPIAGFTVESRRRVIARLAREAPDGPLPEALERHAHDPTLLTTVWTVTALLLGIVFLMTNKPSLMGALITMAVALVLGLVAGMLVVSRRSRTGGQSADAEANRVANPIG